MTSLFPHFVDAQQSAMRGLNIGWSEWRPRSLGSALAQASVKARKPLSHLAASEKIAEVSGCRFIRAREGDRVGRKCSHP